MVNLFDINIEDVVYEEQREFERLIETPAFSELDIACKKQFDILQEYSKYRVERSRVNDWTFRVMHESLFHEHNCVVTFTYNDRHLPPGGNLSLPDFQKLLKRMRKDFRFRYFACGEYGSKGQRPHYHCVFFGYCPQDLAFHHIENGVKYFTSESLLRYWSIFHRKDKQHEHDYFDPIGFIIVCPAISAKVIPYTCKYLQKFNPPPPGCRDPFLVMSRRPGIGALAVDNKSLVDVETDKVYCNGRTRRIPRFYLDKLFARYFTEDIKFYLEHSESLECDEDYDSFSFLTRAIAVNRIRQLRNKRRKVYSKICYVPPDYMQKAKRFYSRLHENKLN